MMFLGIEALHLKLLRVKGWTEKKKERKIVDGLYILANFARDGGGFWGRQKQLRGACA